MTTNLKLPGQLLINWILRHKVGLGGFSDVQVAEAIYDSATKRKYNRLWREALALSLFSRVSDLVAQSFILS